MKTELYVEYDQELSDGSVEVVKRVIEPAQEICPTHFFAAAQSVTTLRWLEKKELFKRIEDLEAEVEALEGEVNSMQNDYDDGHSDGYDEGYEAGQEEA